MPNKILLIAKRDYLAAIQTKAFLVGLVIAPILFGGGVMTSVIAKNVRISGRAGSQFLTTPVWRPVRSLQPWNG